MSWTRWNGRALGKKMENAVSSAMVDTGNAVKAEANQQVPHDEGTLQQSGTVMKNPSNKTEVKIGYGGGGASGYPIVPYAVKWHEVPANFQEGRKHRYLIDPVNSIAPKELKKNLKKAVNSL